jgi:threonine dehydrogenase-like Zn-dependent dehydrogenase
MKALTLLKEYEVSLTDVLEPTLEEGMLLLQVETVGLCGTDLNSFRGKNPLVTYPRILGHEIAATVLVGAGEISEGTRVAVSPYTSCGICSSCRRGRFNACRQNQTFGVQRDGALTERIVVRPDKVYGSTLPLRTLALVEPLTVGFHAVARARVKEADTVVVLGCGGIGLGAVVAAAYRSSRVIAVDMDDAKLSTAKKLGAWETIHSKDQDLESCLRDLTGGDGPNVVIEAIGMPETYRIATEIVSFAGRVVYIGYSKEPVVYETRVFVEKELDIMGSRNALPEDFQAVIKMLEEGRFPVELAISAEVPLASAPSILRAWSADPTMYTKILINLH